MIVIEEGNVNEEISVLEKQKSPNVLVELGSNIEESDWQYSNAWSSIFINCVQERRSMDSRELQ